MFAAVFVIGLATPKRAVAQDTSFAQWPPELASRAPALAESIEHKYGDRPRSIAFAGRDTLKIWFWSPRIWQDHMDSWEFPQETLKTIRQSSTELAAYVWTAFGRDVGVNVIRVGFVRVVHDDKFTAPRHEAPAQEVSAMFNRKMLETGQPPMLMIAEPWGHPRSIFQREGGRRDETASAGRPTRLLAPAGGVVGADTIALGRAALADSIQREMCGEICNVRARGRDTIDVFIPNPQFWWKDDTTKALPQESLPTVRETAKRAANFIWTRHADRAGVNLIQITFRRDWREYVAKDRTVQREGQDVVTEFTREQLVTGKLDPVQLKIIQRW